MYGFNKLQAGATIITSYKLVKCCGEAVTVRCARSGLGLPHTIFDVRDITDLQPYFSDSVLRLPKDRYIDRFRFVRDFHHHHHTTMLHK